MDADNDTENHEEREGHEGLFRHRFTQIHTDSQINHHSSIINTKLGFTGIYADSIINNQSSLINVRDTKETRTASTPKLCGFVALCEADSLVIPAKAGIQGSVEPRNTPNTRI